MKIIEFAPEIFGIDKPAGMTPLEALETLRKEKPELVSTPLTYAGRLDPMAEGLLLVLAGSKVHEKENFLGLDKTYQVAAILGLTTDSFDLLGIPSRSAMHGVSEDTVAKALQQYIGQTSLALPPFSSPPHKGKPLFWWAKQNATPNLPKRTTEIFSIKAEALSTLSSQALLSYIESTVPHVRGDFRQAQIMADWRTLLRKEDAIFPLVRFTVHCASGTYIRALVHEFGHVLTTGACVYTLRRTRVGPYTL